MKEFYIAPEAEIICFAPVENIAGSDPWGYFSNSGGYTESQDYFNPEENNTEENGVPDPE